MGILHTPREVLKAAKEAAALDRDAPGAGMGLLANVEAKLQERGLLDTHMSASSVEALLEETADAYLAAQEVERRHAETIEFN